MLMVFMAPSLGNCLQLIALHNFTVYYQIPSGDNEKKKFTLLYKIFYERQEQSKLKLNQKNSR